MAVANYRDVWGAYPPPYLVGADGRPWHSWRVLLLLYLNQTDLYHAYNFAEPWDGPNNRRLAEQMPRIFAFHGTYRQGMTTTNYLAVVGPETAWPGRPITEADVTDGLSNTILIVENRGAGIHWMEPRDLTFATFSDRLNTPQGIGSPYLDPAVVTMDDSVQKLEPDIPPETLRALLTIRGGEPIRHDGGLWTPLPDGRDREAAP